MYKFYVKMDGNTFGPYSAKEILGLGLLDDTMVTEERLNGEWYPAIDLDFEECYMKETGQSIGPDGVIHRDASEILSDPNDSYSIPVIDNSEPDILGKWNWGAFLFGWIWGVCNGVYWTLIMIPLGLLSISYIPIVNLILCIFLGINGNKMAWKAKHWDSANSFKQCQHNWAIAALIVFCIILISVIIIVVSRNLY